MDEPTLSGSDAELLALTEWLSAISRLRVTLINDPELQGEAAERAGLLARRLKQAENRLRALIGQPPLM